MRISSCAMAAGHAGLRCLRHRRRGQGAGSDKWMSLSYGPNHKSLRLQERYGSRMMLEGAELINSPIAAHLTGPTGGQIVTERNGAFGALEWLNVGM
ncbi:uncharacterized protein BDZ99DRAFT_36757 [Mytilinidion resinicola]|uniref:Uncharacterized protein n=1 Tax=Mytilinidion resinicola TaxID=574789 RepID=A0A6A6YML8_9PEZI|nr:uncharacterized protein BDZ99DRAFT_36757 [Mytilinidion resinicola]KAF2809799.1 hypothetical protein BDZ99DRAFT_36757 [Mytilinidion resinicola]